MKSFQTLLVLFSLLSSNFAQSAVEASYPIQPGDTLRVVVWKETDLQMDVLVRPDGGISFPLAGDLIVENLTIPQVQTLLQQKIAKFIPDPEVAVMSLKTDGSAVYVIGKVNRPGAFPLVGKLDVIQALSLGGGANAFAAVNDIKILRRNNKNQLQAIDFRYADVEKGENLEQNILLRSGDTVVVP